MNSMDFSVNVASPDWGTLRPELGFCAPSSESSVLPFGGSFSLLGGLKVCSLLELCSLREEWWSASLLGTFGLLSASSPQLAASLDRPPDDLSSASKSVPQE